MKTFLILAAIAALTIPAYAFDFPGSEGRGETHQPTPTKAERAASRAARIAARIAEESSESSAQKANEAAANRRH